MHVFQPGMIGIWEMFYEQKYHRENIRISQGHTARSDMSLEF